MNLTKPLISLIVLVALLLALSALSYEFLSNQQRASPSVNSNPVDARGVRIPPSQPALKPEDFVAAQNPHGFQLLISYVNSGFEPVNAAITSGATVRFTNNSTGLLWIAASGANLYPVEQNGCGSSALDSCQALAPGEYWQFTFEKTGTWTYRNNLDKSKTGTVKVK